MRRFSHTCGPLSEYNGCTPAEHQTFACARAIASAARQSCVVVEMVDQAGDTGGRGVGENVGDVVAEVGEREMAVGVEHAEA